MRSQTQADQADFNRRADLVDTDDGTLASNKSQVEQAAKQVSSDSRSTLNRAKDALKDFLKK